MAKNADQMDDSDESLVARVCEGDHQAFAQLVERHSGLFYSAAYRMCANAEEAEEIVQDAFLKLWEKPQSYDAGKGAKFTTWFYRVVTNLAIDRARRKKTQAGPDVLDFMADQRPLADEVLVQNDREAALETAIQSLPERQKAALNLCFYEGFSNKEAAEILGIGVKALESLLMRAKTALKDDPLIAGLLEKPAEKKQDRIMMFDDLDHLLKIRKQPEVPEYLSARIVAAARRSQAVSTPSGIAGWRAWPQMALAAMRVRLSMPQMAYALAGLVVFVVGVELGVQADSVSLFSGLSVGDLAEFMAIDDTFVVAEWV